MPTCFESLFYLINVYKLCVNLCLFAQIKDRKRIEQNLHSVTVVTPQEWDLGCWGSKTLGLGFAMAPHRMRVLVIILHCYT